MFLVNRIISVDAESPSLSPPSRGLVVPQYTLPSLPFFCHRYFSADLSPFLRPLTFVSDRTFFYRSTTKIICKISSNRREPFSAPRRSLMQLAARI